MNTSFPFLRTDNYLSAQWRGSQAPRTTKPATTFVTISREAGSGGASLARLLARKLNAEAPDDVVWQVFEDNLTPKMLKEHDLPVHLARFLPEGRVSEIQSSLGEMIGLHPNLWDLVQKINKTMRDLAARGNVILVGRGANFATAEISNGVHARLIAPKFHRAKYLAQLYNISEQEALVYNIRCDHARRSYAKAYFDADDRDPSAYDLVINTGKISLVAAAKLLASHVQSRVSAPR